MRFLIAGAISLCLYLALMIEACQRSTASVGMRLHHATDTYEKLYKVCLVHGDALKYRRLHKCVHIERRPINAINGSETF
jgi:hypothetical protein